MELPRITMNGDINNLRNYRTENKFKLTLEIIIINEFFDGAPIVFKENSCNE